MFVINFELKSICLTTRNKAGEGQFQDSCRFLTFSQILSFNLVNIDQEDIMATVVMVAKCGSTLPYGSRGP